MNERELLKIIVYGALLSALAIILNFIEIPYIIPWLKLDISEVITLVATSINVFIGLIVALAKGFFMTITGSSSGFIGEAALVIGSLVIVGSYYSVRKVSNVVIALICTTLIFTIVMTILNYYFITPFYFDMPFSELKASVQPLSFNGNEISLSYFWYIIILYVPFNLIKMIIDSTIFYFLQKKLGSSLNNE